MPPAANPPGLRPDSQEPVPCQTISPTLNPAHAILGQVHIVQLKGDGIHKELKRVVVRGSKLSQDGISQLRNALPKTVLEE